MEWRNIPGYDKDYFVSDTGRVLSKKKYPEGRVIKGCVNNLGYHLVRFRDNNGKVRGCLIHRLVAMAFLPPPRNGETQIDHIDGNPHNNSVENLRWVSGLKNKIYAAERNGQKFLSKPVIAIKPDGIRKIYRCAFHAERDFGLYHGKLRQVVKGKNIFIDRVFFTSDYSIKTYPSIEEMMRRKYWLEFLLNIPKDVRLTIKRPRYCRSSTKVIIRKIQSTACYWSIPISAAYIDKDTFMVLISTKGEKLHIRKHK